MASDQQDHSLADEADGLSLGGEVGGNEAAAQAGVVVQESGSLFLEGRGGNETLERRGGGDETSGQEEGREGSGLTPGAQDDDAFSGQQPAQYRHSAAYSSFRSSISDAESDLVDVEETFKMWLSRSRRLLEDMKQQPPDVACETAAQSVGCLRQSEELDKMLRCLSAFPAALNTMVDNEERARGAGGEPPEERRELMVKVFRTTAGVKMEVDWRKYFCVVDATLRTLSLFTHPHDTQAAVAISLTGRVCAWSADPPDTPDPSSDGTDLTSDAASTEFCISAASASSPQPDAAAPQDRWALFRGFNGFPLLPSNTGSAAQSVEAEAAVFVHYWCQAPSGEEARAWVRELHALGCAPAESAAEAFSQDPLSSQAAHAAPSDNSGGAEGTAGAVEGEVVEQGVGGGDTLLAQALLRGAGWGVGAGLSLPWALRGASMRAIESPAGAADAPPEVLRVEAPHPDIDVSSLDEYALLGCMVEYAGSGSFFDLLCDRLHVLHAELPAHSIEQLLPALVNLAVASSSTTSSTATPAGNSITGNSIGQAISGNSTGQAISGSGRLERCLADMMAVDIHFAFVAVSTIEAAGVSQQSEFFSAFSMTLGGEGAAGKLRDRIQGELDRLRMLAETAAVSGKRMGLMDNADTLVERASQMQLEQEARLRAIYPGTRAWRDGSIPEEVGEEAAPGTFDRWRLQVARRKAFFFEQHDLIERFCSIGISLGSIPKGIQRDEQLKAWLRDMNQALPNGCYIPLCSSSARHRVLCSLPPDGATVLTSYNNTPFLVLAETVQLDHPVCETLAVLCAADILQESLIDTASSPNGAAFLKPPSSLDSMDGGGTQPEGAFSRSAPEIASLRSASGEQRGRSSDGIEWGEGGKAASASPRLGLWQASEQLRGVAPGGHSGDVDGEQAPAEQNDDAAGGVEERESDTPLPSAKASVVTPTGLVGQALLAEVFGEAWSVKTERVRRMSRFGGHPGWGLSAVIVKAGDDLRQEQFAMLLLGRIKEVWDAQGLGLHLRTYSILATSPSSGLIEMVPDSVSLSSLRKKLPGFTTLAEFYRQAFGGAGSATFMAAQDNFMRSTAAYSVCCYVLKLKDRHDGNILIQRDGSVVHVDFGFMLGRHMNEVLTVERAPFKLTRDYVDLMGGEHSACFLQYIALCIQGLKVLRNHSAELLSICKAMAVGSPLACVSTPRELLDLEERLCLHKTDKEMVDTFVSLQSQALRSWSTTAYDRLQKLLGVY